MKTNYEELKEELKAELQGKKMSFWELDNYMMGEDLGSVADVADDVRKNECAIYTLDDNNWVSIDFDVVNDGNEEENEENEGNFTLIVTDVELV